MSNNNISAFYSIVQNYIRWNFSKRGSRGEHRQSRYWANKQQWTTRIRNNQGNQHIKNKFSHFKSILRRLETTHRPSQSINAPTKSLSTSSHPPWGAHLGRANAPAEAPGPGRSEEQARYHMKIHMHKKCGNAKKSKTQNRERTWK